MTMSYRSRQLLRSFTAPRKDYRCETCRALLHERDVTNGRHARIGIAFAVRQCGPVVMIS